MKKRNFLILPHSLKTLIAPVSFIAILILVLITGGCGKSVYIAPDNEVNTHIILINKIYSPGFYVEIDGKDAGFLQEELNIRVKPGNHKLKIFNKETSLSLLQENQITTTHNFDLAVKVGDGEDKAIELSWEDKGYTKDTEKQIYRTEKEKEEIKKKREGQRPGGGMPTPGSPF